MFVQLVRGVIADPEATFARLDDWLEHLSPGATGWLGTTAGITADRELVALVRFATIDDARASSDRMEQGLWWAGSVLLFTGDVTFENYDDVDILGDGGSDAAGRVEVLLGRVRPGHPTKHLRDQLTALTANPAVGAIGSLLGQQEDGHFAHVVWFCRSVSAQAAPVLDAQALLRGPSTGARLLRLDRLWFGSPLSGSAGTRVG